jgi:hypothetical protein
LDEVLPTNSERVRISGINGSEFPEPTMATPKTVVDWHRAGFRLYWKWLSRVRSTGGRKPVSPRIRALIFRMVAENPTWGAPRIHGELLMLGFNVSEVTVSRWMRRAPRPLDAAFQHLSPPFMHPGLRPYPKFYRNAGSGTYVALVPAGDTGAPRAPSFLLSLLYLRFAGVLKGYALHRPTLAYAL